MIHFDLPKEQSSILKVIGVGGGGSNAVNHMHAQEIEGVDFIICNTDAQAIANSKVPNKIQLGPHLTQGLGAGANPEIGRQATEESLEEIKKILEVNTKMAFITAGMGGGTGTGGAPIISKICKDLGILTVGIVTTPFGYEGKKRYQQAMNGIEQMKQYVDTLLVISNDKLRIQFRNLKTSEAFIKADNVLATAAKCITDVITSTGQINVDFADVSTVMRGGGVAILGSASAGGETRAQQAIEDALNSPLLNNNDIRGAKWILININSAEGEYERTMDEVEIIQNYLFDRAGEDTDVILGMGYDNTLGDKISVTLIATGFQEQPDLKLQAQKDSKAEPESKNETQKIILNLEPAEEPKIYAPGLLFSNDSEVTSENKEEVKTDIVVETSQERIETVFDEPVTIELLELNSTETAFDMPVVQIISEDSSDDNKSQSIILSSENEEKVSSVVADEHTLLPGFLTKPAVIYQDTTEAVTEEEVISKNEEVVTLSQEPELIVEQPLVHFFIEEAEEPQLQMELIEKDSEDIADIDNEIISFEENNIEEAEGTVKFSQTIITDEAEEQRKKAADRLHKLRNLSFNYNAADPNNEFETVPAYIRKNLDLYNTISPAENFYSNYSVQKDDENKVHIDNRNTFLYGNRPD
ncbi:MAG: cell division protein FtsZ [Bacteroidota bacterium]